MSLSTPWFRGDLFPERPLPAIPCFEYNTSHVRIRSRPGASGPFDDFGRAGLLARATPASLGAIPERNAEAGGWRVSHIVAPAGRRPRELPD